MAQYVYGGLTFQRVGWRRWQLVGNGVLDPSVVFTSKRRCRTWAMVNGA